MLSDPLYVKGVEMLHFLATFIFLLRQHIIVVIKLQQPKYEKSLFSGMLIIKASCLLKRPLMNGKDKVASSECFAAVSQIP